MFNKVDVYENCLKDYEEGYKLDVNLWDIIIIDDDNNAEQIVEVGTPADGEVAEATVEMFKLLEDSEKGDNIIIFEFWAEIYEGNTYDSYDYHYVNSISAYKKYYVTDEVLEEFNDYIELVYEFEKDRLEDEYYDYEDYEDVTVKETETKSIEQIVVPE